MSGCVARAAAAAATASGSLHPTPSIGTGTTNLNSDPGMASGLDELDEVKRLPARGALSLDPFGRPGLRRPANVSRISLSRALVTSRHLRTQSKDMNSQDIHQTFLTVDATIGKGGEGQFITSKGASKQKSRRRTIFQKRAVERQGTHVFPAQISRTCLGAVTVRARRTKDFCDGKQSTRSKAPGRDRAPQRNRSCNPLRSATHSSRKQRESYRLAAHVELFGQRQRADTLETAQPLVRKLLLIDFLHMLASQHPPAPPVCGPGCWIAAGTCSRLDATLLRHVQVALLLALHGSPKRPSTVPRARARRVCSPAW